MLANPRFRASLDVQVLEPRFLFLLDEHQHIIIEGEAFALLAPYLDGRHTFAEILHAVEGRLSFAHVIAALQQLQKRGVLVEGADSPVTESSPYYEYLRPGVATPAGEEALELLAPYLDGRHTLPEIVRAVAGRITFPQILAALRWHEQQSGALGTAGGTHPRRGEGLHAGIVRTAVKAVGNVSSEQMMQALEANDLVVDDEGEVLVVVTDDYLRPELAAYNREALEQKRPWLLVKPVGLRLWLGPLFQPGETGCWSCLAQRLGCNRQTEKYIADHTAREGPVLPVQGHLPGTLALGYQLAALQLLEWLVFGTGRLKGQLVTLDLTYRYTQVHTLVRRPQCRACGADQRPTASRAPFRLSSQLKRFRGDGGHRTMTPEETFQRYRHHISPILGAVSELMPALGHWSALAPSFVAGHNFSMGADSIVFLKERVRGVSGGKGITEIQAKVSGLCEALERYSGLYLGEEEVVRGTCTALGAAAIHPNECMGFSAEQYRDREAWNGSQPFSRCHLIPKPFDEKLEIDWTPLWSLTHERVRYLPTAYCYYGHPEFAGRWCFADSNGSAAGNTREEAILQGFLELVERDAVAFWWYNRIPRRGVDLSSFADPYVPAIQSYYTALRRELWVLDITSDLPVPTFACVSRRVDRPVEDILVGFGAHFDARVAMLRAITEVNQFLPSVTQQNPDGSTRYLFGDELARRWWTTATLKDNSYLLPQPELPPAGRSEFEDLSTDDLRDDVHTCARLIHERGLEMLVLDQTRPDIGLAAVKVVVPRMCHFWRRLGHQRLYEVPVRMGWLKRPFRAEELNPNTIFF